MNTHPNSTIRGQDGLSSVNTVAEQGQRDYYECHITVNPVFGDQYKLFADLAQKWRFKAAELLLQKNREDTPERSSKDSFCTGHSRTYDDIYSRMDALHRELEAQGFHVWRRKIEHVIYDEKFEREA